MNQSHVARRSSSGRPSSRDPGAALGDDGRTFLQSRLATYALVIFLFYIPYFPVFYLIWSADPAVGVRRAVEHATDASALCLGLVHLTFVVVTRVRTWSVSTLALLDVAFNVSVGVAFSAIVLHHPHAVVALLEGLLALASLLWLRALLVPSSARRSVLVGLCVCGALSFALLTRADHFESGALAASTLTLLFFNWALMIVGFSAYASSVLYGLRRQVQKAERYGQYTLLEKLGEGGMGVVYRAQHAMLRRPTALKLLTGSSEELNLVRFEQEVQLMAELRHQSTVTVYDYGRTAEGVFYYAMEHLDGIDLEGLVELTGPQPPARVIALLCQAAGALGEAHTRGLIHRDIKPGNIFLCSDHDESDLVKVLDFGLVKDSRREGSAHDTGEHTLLGTPLYMSPESISTPSAIDARSDLYSLAAVGYLLLCGKPVFSGKTVVEVCAHHLFTEPVPPSQRLSGLVAPELEAVLLRCLAKQPSERFADAATFASALACCAQQGSWTPEAARAWWSTQRPAIEARRAARAAGQPLSSLEQNQTLAIVDYREFAS